MKKKDKQTKQQNNKTFNKFSELYLSHSDKSPTNTFLLRWSFVLERLSDLPTLFATVPRCFLSDKLSLELILWLDAFILKESAEISEKLSHLQ